MRKKRLWSAPLALVIVLLTAMIFGGIAVQADGDYPIGGEYGSNLTWQLDSQGTLTISGSGEMPNTSIPWNNYRSDIKKVVIDDGVTSVSSGAFYSCTNLTSVTFGSSIKTINEGAFANCSSLSSVNLPPVLESIRYNAFSGCAFESITIPSTVKTIGEYAFAYSGLKSITIPGSVETLDRFAFRECQNLKTAILSSGVTSIPYGLFYECRNLTSVTIPDSVTTIGGESFYRAGLTSLSLPSGITSIGQFAFYSCKSLTSLDLTFDNDVSFDRGVFNNCEGIETVKISGNITSLGNSMFYCCKALTSVTLPDSVKNIYASAFEGCEILESITLPAEIELIDGNVFSGCSSLKTITIPATMTEIKPYAFSGCGLTSIVIPGNIETIGSGAFRYCSKLSSVTIENGVQTIGDSAFAECGALKSISIPGSVTAIGNSAFYRSGLTSVRVLKNVEYGEEVFSYCRDLVTVSFDTGFTSVPNGMFSGCTSLKTLTLPDSITTIGSYAYHDCGFETLVVPGTVKTIKDHAFSECEQLKTVKLGSGVQTIEDLAFENCHELEALFIPDSIQSIGGNSFIRCIALKDIYCEAAPGFAWEDDGDDFMVLPYGNKTICHVNTNYTADFEAQYYGVNVTFIGDLGDTSSRVVGHSITLDADIGVNFYICLADGYSASNVTVELSWGVGADYQHNYKGKLVPVDMYGANYKVTCPVAARAMGDTITMVVKSGNTELFRDTYAVIDYMNVLAYKYPFDYELQDLLASMLWYGASSQRHFKYKGSLGQYLYYYADENYNRPIDCCPRINGNSKDAILSYVTGLFWNDYVEVNDEDITITKLSSDELGISYYGASSISNSQMKMRFYFRVTDATKAKNLTATFRSKGLTFTKRTVNNEELIYIETPGLLPGELEDPLVITINGTQYTYDFKDYIRRCYKNGGTYFDVATYQYALSHYSKKYQEAVARNG